MGTFDKIKEGFKKTADKVEDSAERVADPDTYKGSKNEKEWKMKRAVASQ
jgi:hypothetical protein